MFFRFEAVPVDAFFPLGVKLTYRRYSEMEAPVPELKMTPLAPCGFREEFCDVSWFPEKKPATATEPEQQEGMYIMSKYSINDIKAACCRAEFRGNV